jgi:hypothetical protein
MRCSVATWLVRIWADTLSTLSYSTREIPCNSIELLLHVYLAERSNKCMHHCMISNSQSSPCRFRLKFPMGVATITNPPQTNSTDKGGGLLTINILFGILTYGSTCNTRTILSTCTCPSFTLPRAAAPPSSTPRPPKQHVQARHLQDNLLLLLVLVLVCETMARQGGSGSQESAARRFLGRCPGFPCSTPQTAGTSTCISKRLHHRVGEHRLLRCSPNSTSMRLPWLHGHPPKMRADTTSQNGYGAIGQSPPHRSRDNRSLEPKGYGLALVYN